MVSVHWLFVSHVLTRLSFRYTKTQDFDSTFMIHGKKEMKDFEQHVNVNRVGTEYEQIRYIE